MKCILQFVAFLCLACPMALAQNAQLGGLVKDKTGAVVPQAQVTLKNVDTASLMRAKTDKVGFFIYTSVQPGRYELSAEAAGFDKTLIKGIKIDTAANVSQDVMLQIKQGSQEITVTGKAELTTTNGTVSTVISHELIENMPLNGNDLMTLFELSPGTLLNAGGGEEVGGGFSVDGQRPTANYLTVDGASGEAYVPTLSVNGANNTGAGIATSASGGTNGILPVDAIEEYRMDTATYTAENGRTPGGQIQVRTRSGTNQFHGTLFENFRNQILDAEDWFTKYDNLAQAQLRMNEFGGTLGGPVIIPRLFDGRNKLFFFVANDNLVLDQPNTATENYVPDASLMAGAYPAFKSWLSIFPSGNTAVSSTCPPTQPYCVLATPSFDYFSASYPNLIRDHTTSLRVDWQLPRSIHAFFRANVAPSSSTQVLKVVQGEGSHVSVNTYTGGLTIPLGSRMVDELTVNHTSDNTRFRDSIPSTGGNSPGALQDNLPNGVSASLDSFEFEPEANPKTGGYSQAYVGPVERNELHQWNVVDTFALHQGKNTIKFGVDFLRRQSILQGFRNSYNLYVVTGNAAPYTNTDLDTGVISSLETQKYIASPTIALSNTSLFVNNDWKATSSLTLNAGVRWELDPAATVGPLGAIAFVGNNLNPATFQDALSTKPLYQERYDNFAPRFGFSWAPRTRSGMVVRGGVGIYFDTGQAATVAGTNSAETYPYVYTQTFSEIPYASVNWTALGGTQGSVATSPVYLVDPHLLSPRTYEWSLTLDQAFGRYTKLTTSYVGNDGEKLIGQDQYYNGINSSGQHPVNTTYVRANGDLYITTNQSHSNYQALQSQLTSRMGQRLSILASYTWGHAEDNGSSDFSSVGAVALNPMANSANDVRQMFAMAIHYAPDGFKGNHTLQVVTGGWGLDTIVRLQSASPFTVTYSNSAADNVNQYISNADIVPGEPTILREHINSGTVVPGNKLLNWAAFTSPPLDSSGNQLRNGNSPTNGYRLFGLKQWDMAASRSWKIWEGLNLNFRVDAYNLLNVANFGTAGIGSWNSSNNTTFGRATATYANTYGAGSIGNGSSGEQLNIFQNGGPRELQLSLKLKF